MPNRKPLATLLAKASGEARVPPKLALTDGLVHIRAMNAPAPIATPCVKVCIVDGASGLCLGCYRTLREIARWQRLEASEREQVMSELASRRSKIDPAKLG